MCMYVDWVRCYSIDSGHSTPAHTARSKEPAHLLWQSHDDEGAASVVVVPARPAIPLRLAPWLVVVDAPTARTPLPSQVSDSASPEIYIYIYRY